MDYYIAAFRSRTHSLQFIELLKKYRIYASAVNTPKEAGVGCGLSARFMPTDFCKVKNVLKSFYNESFAGFFSVERKYGRIIVKVL